MFPKCFNAAGVIAGIYRKKHKKDMALFYSSKPCVAAGMFTKNLVKAAPVLVSESKIRNVQIRAVVANSGNANACTGKNGLKDAHTECALIGKELGIDEKEVLVASTGVIGQFLPMQKISSGIKKLASGIRKGSVDFNSASEAIMTTDTVRKVSSRTFKIQGRSVSIWACAKGSGMIHPDMAMPHATMLAFILTDAAISRQALNSSLKAAVDRSFNCVSVDGDTSTNDSVIALANGSAMNAAVTGGGRSYDVFLKNISDICVDLAKMIAKDGEGATKLVELEIKNARDVASARKIASVIATSPLVKTALFGLDANWGRIIAAAGRSGVKISPEKTEICIGRVKVFSKGMPCRFSESKAKKELSKKEVKIKINLNSGKENLKYYTCDLSFDYIKINASYRT